MTYTKRLLIRANPMLYFEMKEHAKEQNITGSEFARIAINRYIQYLDTLKERMRKAQSMQPIQY